MKFESVFVEKQVADWPRTQEILAHLRNPRVDYIRKVEDYFGRYRKPYLHKRDQLQLFIGRKEGALVKQTPPAYGFTNAPHFYFIHSYNCIFECQYCYLQGYFSSPDIVLFVNHEEICQEIERIVAEDFPREKEVWFHAGEYSDSLALSGLTGELPVYWETFKKYPRAHLELRTKSVNIRPLLELEVLPNVIPTFSLGSSDAVERFDLRTPPLAARLKAIAKLVKRGYAIGIHFDPIVMQEGLIEAYRDLCEQLSQVLPDEALRYLSLGVVRFTKDVYRQVEKNYPGSAITSAEYVTSFDGKVRYPKPLRNRILSAIEEELLRVGYSRSKLYRCMEDDIPSCSLS